MPKWAAFAEADAAPYFTVDQAVEEALISERGVKGHFVVQ